MCFYLFFYDVALTNKAILYKQDIHPSYAGFLFVSYTQIKKNTHNDSRLFVLITCTCL